MKKDLELFALRLNLLVASAYTVFGLVIAYFAKSLTVLLDAGYSLVALIVYLVSLYVVNKIKQPGTQEYPYGFYKLEPIFVIVQATSVLLLAILIIATSILNLIFSSIIANYYLAISATIVAVLLCFSMYFYIRSVANKTGSKILTADAQLWKADAIISAGVVVGLSIGFILERTWFHSLAIYVDPVIASILACIVVIKPIKLMLLSFRQLLDTSPAVKKRKALQAMVHTIAQESSININEIKVTEAGRYLYIDIRPTGSQAQVCDYLAFKKDVLQKCQKVYENQIIEIVISF